MGLAVKQPLAYISSERAVACCFDLARRTLTCKLYYITPKTIWGWKRDRRGADSRRALPVPNTSGGQMSRKLDRRPEGL